VLFYVQLAQLQSLELDGMHEISHPAGVSEPWHGLCSSYVAMTRALNYADVAIRPDGDQWVVLDHANRWVSDRRYSRRSSAIRAGLLLARDTGGALWIGPRPRPSRVRSQSRRTH
jgi:hypothetical protein